MESNINKFIKNSQRKENKPRDIQRIQETSKQTLCLNPNCLSPRLFNSPLNIIDPAQHQKCKGWIHNLDLLRNGFRDQKSIGLNSFVSMDYLQKPIESIFEAQKFGSIGWEDQLFTYFQQIHKRIDDELTSIYLKAQKQISNHLKINNEISTKIQVLCQDIGQRWESSHQQIFSKYLKNGLLQINMKGRISISNNQMMNKKIGQIIKEIKQIGQCVWNEELKYDLDQRKLFKAKREEINNYNNLQASSDINLKIQQIENYFKQKIKFIQNKNNTQTICLRCPQSVQSAAPSIKLRKQQCRKLILAHLAAMHIEQLTVKMVKKFPIKLTIADVKKQIMLKGIKKVIVIDKQNSIYNANTQLSCSDLYCIQVLSKLNQNIAKDRYLIAESTGKDAADILIVIVLYELSKLQLDQIILLTNDHYGSTLQPIFSNLGVNIKLMNKTTKLKSIPIGG